MKVYRADKRGILYLFPEIILYGKDKCLKSDPALSVSVTVSFSQRTEFWLGFSEIEQELERTVSVGHEKSRSLRIENRKSRD